MSELCARQKISMVDSNFLQLLLKLLWVGYVKPVHIRTHLIIAYFSGFLSHLVGQIQSLPKPFCCRMRPLSLVDWDQSFTVHSSD